jgi:hypothetical protein
MHISFRREGRQMARNTPLVYRGKIASLEEVADVPIVVAGFGLPEDAGYVFQTDDELRGWAREIGQDEMVARLDEAAKKGRERESQTDLAVLETWQKRRVQRITDDLNSLAELHGLPVNSAELLRKATLEADPVMGSVFDPYLLFDRTECGGGFRPIAGLVPRFGWIDFNNKASSANGLGGGTLFSRYWFRGKRLYLINIGNDVGDCLDLGDLGWSNIASSAIAI